MMNGTNSLATSAKMLCAMATTLAIPLAVTTATAQDLLWSRQSGTSEYDNAYSVAVDSAGNAYVTGDTDASLGGTHMGERDAFLAKYDASGALLWKRQMGTTGDDPGNAVGVDGAGNAYISGWTKGSLGGPHAGDWDVFLARYDAAGDLLWTRQFGSPAQDVALAMAVDSTGTVYIVGSTDGSLFGPNAGSWDVFLAKYDASGAMLWTRQFGTSASDSGYGVDVDGAGNVYITGGTTGSLGGFAAGYDDIFLAKYDASGALLWMRQTGSYAQDVGHDVAVDRAGNAYVTGWTDSDLGGQGAGFWDVFLSKFDTTGALLWTHQVGSSLPDAGYGVALDGAGSAYVTGFTKGSLFSPHAGGNDLFVAKYNAAGSLLWRHQAGTSASDLGTDVAVDSAGNAYIAGATSGSLYGPSAGRYDYFLAKFGEAPCYADCDKSTGNGVLDIFDFLCFQNSFVLGETYACDCDTSTGVGVCDVFDFLCFQDAFVAGCP